MNVMATINNCWHRLLPVLAVLFVPAVMAQGIVLVQMPPTILSTNGLPPGITPVVFPEDALGTYVGDPVPIVINGQTICTFYPAFSVIGSSTNTIIGQQPYLDFPDTVFVVPLTRGQEIGPNAAGYGWFNGGLLSSSIASETIEDPVLTAGYFVDVESAYLGFNFFQDGQTYYGWIRVGSPYAFITGTMGWIYDYAYETNPNTPILAGQISEPVSFTANLIGANEMPPNRSANSGMGMFTLESFVGNFLLTYHIELDGSFHPTEAGIFGPPLREGRPPILITNFGMAQIVFSSPPPPLGPVPFFSARASLNSPAIVLPPPSHIVYDGQISLSSNQVVQLQRGQLYVNLESARFRQGELRGQIWPSAPVQFSTTLSSHTEFSRNHNVPRGEAQFTLSGTALSYEIAVDTNFSRIIAGVYGSGICQVEVGNRMIWLNTTFAVRIPPGGIPNSPGLPGQLLYSGELTLPDRQISELDSGQAYLEVLAPGCRNGWIGGRIIQNP
jgi:hypothetical protein